MDRRQFVVGSTAAVTLAVSAKFANAQSSNSIRIIFPYAAGGSGDATVRLLADKMQRELRSAGRRREPDRRRRPHRGHAVKNAAT